MIKINLLRKRKSKGSLNIDFSKINFKFVILAIFFFIVSDYIGGTYLKNIEAAIDKQIVEISTKNQTLDEQIKENEKVKVQVENYKAQITLLEERSKLVDRIVQLRKNPKDLLERIARDTPNDLWFTLLKMDDPLAQSQGSSTAAQSSSGATIEIQGSARSYASIGDFINKANSSRFFGTTLQLKESQTVSSGDGPNAKRTESYTISGKIVAY